jgi:ABC-type multidrug transport system ATPase subunit
MGLARTAMLGEIIFIQGDRSVAVSLPPDAERATTIGSGGNDAVRVESSLGTAFASIRWSPRDATWELEAQPGVPFTINGIAPPSPGNRAVLRHMDLIDFPDVVLRFQKLAASPKFHGKSDDRLALKGIRKLVIGREAQEGTAPNEIPDAERWELDSGALTVSRMHVLIEEDKGQYYIENLSRRGTELNGLSAFSRERLVYGDRFDIGDNYTFEFDGISLNRVEKASGGTVSSRKISKRVKDRKGTKLILNGVTLNTPSGEFLGILGASGQGKSTLLNCLCGINPASSGSVSLNGIPLDDRRKLRSLAIGYVPQDDIVHRELTVEQVLNYSARLRLKLDKTQTRSLINRVIERLGLTEHAHKRVSMLSGGQRKRVSIGTELLSKPSVLFLDEPSSGLDPAAEEDLMILLQTLTQTGLTVICTTHVLNKAYIFSRICFIHGGRLIFLGTSDEARSHFLLSDDASATATSSGTTLENTRLEKIYALLVKGKESAEEWEERFARSPLADKASRQIPAVPPLKQASKRSRVGFLPSLFLLISRQWRILLADKLNLAFLLAQALVIGLLVGWVSDDPGFRMFLCIVATLWFGCGNGAQQIVGEISIYRRERVNGLGVNAYTMSKFFFLTAVTTTQAIILFFTINLSASLFNPVDFDKNAFTESLIQDRLRLDTGEDSAGLDDIFGDDAESGKPAALRSDSTHIPIPILSWMARTLALESNILDSGWKPRVRVDPENLSQETAEDYANPREGIPLDRVILTTLGLRALAVLLASIVGVAMGLAISALVQSSTQAVMWVPLVLIPQILFGGYVVSLPEMPKTVRAFSYFMPSFAAERIMEVSHLYGQPVPKMTNKSKVPVFLSPDGSDEKVQWIAPPGSVAFFRSKADIDHLAGYNRAKKLYDQNYHFYKKTQAVYRKAMGEFISALEAYEKGGSSVSASSTPTAPDESEDSDEIEDPNYVRRIQAQIDYRKALDEYMKTLASYGMTLQSDVEPVKPPEMKEPTEPDEPEHLQWQTYDKMSPHNTAWQNLAVIHSYAGERRVFEFQNKKPDSVGLRTDVQPWLTLYDLYQGLTPAWNACFVLLGWLGGCYILIIGGLASKQTGS